MAERDRMEPGELRARREYLGLTQDALGVALGRDGSSVRADTIRRWESGREPIPYGVRGEIAAIEARTQTFVDDLRERPGEQVFHATDDEVRFGTLDWATARWWRHAVIRARSEP